MKQKMYIGPTIPGVIKSNTIFIEVPEDVQKRAKDDRNLKRLIVPMENSFEAKKELTTCGSVLAVAYKEIQKSYMSK